MIDVQHAVREAVRYCSQLFGDAASRFRLEEVEISEDEKHWFVTVGFDEPAPTNTLIDALQGLVPPPTERKYKVVDLDAETGNIRAVKMRQPLERIS